MTNSPTNGGWNASPGPSQSGPAPTQPGQGQYGQQGQPYASAGGYQSPSTSPYSATPYPAQGANPADSGPKSNKMGIIALGLSGLATVLYIVFAVMGGMATAEATSDLTRQLQEASAGTPTTAPQIDASSSLAAGGWMLAMTLPSLLGLAGLIVGIVAAATNKGRWFGVGAIALAVLGPGIAFTIWGVTAAV